MPAMQTVSNKYKPIFFPIAEAVSKNGDTAATVLALAGEIFLYSKLMKAGIPPVFHCGKPRCTGTFPMTSPDKRALVCPICGSEIDWEGIGTKKIKHCPKCGAVGNLWDTYCAFHVPAVKLEVVEVLQ